MVWVIGFDPRPPGSFKETAGLKFFPSRGVSQQSRRIGETELCLLAVRREPGCKEKTAGRRAAKALELAKKQGARRVALPEELTARAKESGIFPIDMREVCWTLSYPIAMAAILKNGLDPMNTLVVLASGQACEEMRQTAWKLASSVRYVTAEGGAFSEAVKRELKLEFGIPPQADLEKQNTVALVFSGKAPDLPAQITVNLTGSSISGMQVPIVLVKDLRWPPFLIEKRQTSGALWLGGAVKESDLEISFQ